MKPILKAENISKFYDQPQKTEILKRVTLTLHEGESLAIAGPSGVGKSTLLHILGTLEKPSGGFLEIMGHQAGLGDQSQLRNRHIGFVFQNFNLLEEYSVIENVIMPAKIGRKPVRKGSEAFTHAEELLKRVGLLSHRNHLAKHLSGGEKQRVAIARAFCNNPDIILADEPSGNLDEENSKRVHELIISWTKESGKGLIVVTHNPSLADLCDRRYLIKDGCLTAVNS